MSGAAPAPEEWIDDDAAIAQCGIARAHVAAFKRVARELGWFVIFRGVNAEATVLIEDNYPTKDMGIKGKSSDWGPQAGFICLNQFFSKIAAKGRAGVGAIDDSNREVQYSLNHGYPAVPLVVSDASLSRNAKIRREGTRVEADIPKATPKVTHIFTLVPVDDGLNDVVAEMRLRKDVFPAAPAHGIVFPETFVKSYLTNLRATIESLKGQPLYFVKPDARDAGYTEACKSLPRHKFLYVMASNGKGRYSREVAALGKEGPPPALRSATVSGLKLRATGAAVGPRAVDPFILPLTADYDTYAICPPLRALRQELAEGARPTSGGWMAEGRALAPAPRGVTIPGEAFFDDPSTLEGNRAEAAKRLAVAMFGRIHPRAKKALAALLPPEELIATGWQLKAAGIASPGALVQSPKPFDESEIAARRAKARGNWALALKVAHEMAHKEAFSASWGKVTRFYLYAMLKLNEAAQEAGYGGGFVCHHAPEQHNVLFSAVDDRYAIFTPGGQLVTVTPARFELYAAVIANMGYAFYINPTYECTTDDGQIGMRTQSATGEAGTRALWELWPSIDGGHPGLTAKWRAAQRVLFHDLRGELRSERTRQLRAGVEETLDEGIDLGQIALGRGKSMHALYDEALKKWKKYLPEIV